MRDLSKPICPSCKVNKVDASKGRTIRMGDGKPGIYYGRLVCHTCYREAAILE